MVGKLRNSSDRYSDLARQFYFKKMEEPKATWISFTDDPKFWSPEFWDLFSGLFCNAVDGKATTVSGAQEMIKNVSSSTKVRCYQDALKAGFIETIDAKSVNDPSIKRRAKKIVTLSTEMLEHCRAFSDGGIDACLEVTKFKP